MGRRFVYVFAFERTIRRPRGLSDGAARGIKPRFQIVRNIIGKEGRGGTHQRCRSPRREMHRQ
jgi:hypothetical protein